MFPLYEQKAKKRCNIDYETTCNKRQRKRKPQYDESKEQEVILDGKDKFRVETFYAVLDQLKSALDKRKTAYDLVANNFSVFSDLSTQPADIIMERADKLQSLILLHRSRSHFLMSVYIFRTFEACWNSK